MTKKKVSNEAEKPALRKGDVSGSFYSLIDRLQACMQKKNPERGIWSNDVYYDIAFQWMGKDKELLERVLKLEKECGL